MNLAKSNSTALGSDLNGSKMESMNGALIVSNPLQSLTDLPDELLLKAIDALDEADLCALGSTCKTFNNLVFPFFFAKHKIHGPLEGYISCVHAPEHTLRAIRCSLSAKNINAIQYYFNNGINRLVGEVEELHAIVRLTDVVTDFRTDLSAADYWGSRDAPLLDQALVPRLTEEEWTKLYLGLLTAALTRGSERADLSGGDWFLGYLQDRDKYTAELGTPPGPVLSFMERVLGNKTTRYFDGSFRYKNPLTGQPKRSSQATNPVAQLPSAEDTVPRAEGSSDNRPATLGVEERKRHTRLLGWIFPAKNKNSSGRVQTAISSSAAYDSNNFKASSPGSNPTQVKNHAASSQPKAFTTIRTRSPTPKLQSLTLHADMYFAVPSFQNWTTQLLSWCASTLTHLELQFPEQPNEIWCKTFSELNLPSLIDFKGTCSPFILESKVQGSDLLSFLARNPSIQKLTFHRLQAPANPSALPNSRRSILPNLMQVTAHPVYLSWLLHDKKRCPKLKEVTLLTGYPNVDSDFEYDDVDRALRDLLPRLHKLDVIGFQFSNDHGELNFWLQSHVNAGPNVGVLSRFIATRCLRINSRWYVNVINDRNRLKLAAQFVGLFPNIDDLEFIDHPGALHDTTKHIPPVIEALRLYSPQLKRVKINDKPPIDIADFGRLEKE